MRRRQDKCGIKAVHFEPVIDELKEKYANYTMKIYSLNSLSVVSVCFGMYIITHLEPIIHIIK